MFQAIYYLKDNYLDELLNISCLCLIPFHIQKPKILSEISIALTTVSLMEYGQKVADQS